MTDAMITLPAEFADLEPFSGWALHGERARYAKRVASTMAELQAFYDAVFPRTEAALEYLDAFPLEALPDDAKHLLWLYCALVTVSFPVEAWRQPAHIPRREVAVPDVGRAVGVEEDTTEGGSHEERAEVVDDHHRGLIAARLEGLAE